MAFIPDAGNVLIGRNVVIQPTRTQPTRTYRINFDTGRVIGFTDETEAMKQAIMKIIETERFRYLIYSWNYGIELTELFGKSWPVVSSEMGRVLREALLADARIDDVLDIVITQIDKRCVFVAFTASTVFGDIPISAEVNTGV